MTISDSSAFLLIHGILHLSGFDHKNQKERAKMEELEEVVLARLGILIDR